MFLSNIAIRRPVLTTMMVAAITIFGILGYLGMGLDLYPEIDFPVVSVRTTLEGASAEVIDVDVTDVLEDRISTIEGIESINSISGEGMSRIVVEFVLDKDIDLAVQDVREKVSLALRRLPEDVDPPIVYKQDIAARPIMWIAVSGDKPYRQLADYARYTIKERLQTIPGVGEVFLGGYRERMVRVWLDPRRLEAHGLTVADVNTALRTKNLEVPAGRIESEAREFTVQVKGEYERVEDFNRLVIAFRNESPIRLRDVGWVEDGSEDLRSLSRFNGKPSVGLGVRRQTGTNLVSVAERVKEELERVKKELPPGFSLSVAFDSSEYIKRSIHDVQFDVLFGALLTSLVILLFLRNLRTTGISIIAIPISLIGAFSLMRALDFTINNVTMLAMSLSVGMVIDDAIVVLENTFRHLESGKEPYKAAQEGVGEIAFAVIAATFSIVAVFLPIAFMKGMIGRFFMQLGLTVVIAIMISLFISLTLTPMLCSRFMRLEEKHGRVYTLLERGFAALDRGYRAVLAAALRHRPAVIALAVIAFAGGLYIASFIERAFVSQADESRFAIRLKTPVGSSLSYTDGYLKEVERIVSGLPETESIFSSLGVAIGETPQVNNGNVYVTMKQVKKRRRAGLRSQQEVMSFLRKKLKDLPGLRASVENISPVGGGRRNTDIEFIVKGPSVEGLGGYSNRITDAMKNTGGFVDIDTNFELTKPEVKVFIDRDKAGDLGVDISSLSETVSALIGGVNVTKYKEGGRRRDVRVRAVGNFRKTPEDISRLLVRSKDGRLVRLSNLVDIKEGAGPNIINRYNRQRAVTIYANLEGLSEGEAHPLMQRFSSEVMPRDSGYRTDFAGRGKRFTESFRYLFFALILAVLIIYMVLASQFESFIHPFTVMLSLPLSMVGAFGALLLTGYSLSIFSYIGIIMLMGIVTKNAILLVDYTNTLRARGLERNEAVLTAGPVRLRPILMTAITTMMGVLPVALALSEGGESRAPMAVATIGGMATSTFLTLIIVPTVYTLLDDLGGWVTKKARKKGPEDKPRVIYRPINRRNG